MLCDQDILDLLKKNPQIISPLPGKYSNLSFDSKAWLSYDSPVQPSSIDLHVGKIFIPERPKGKEGSHGNGAEAYRIKQGESVIVSTYEKLELPPNIAGIVFPPSGKLSSKAILVSNIGHIDPGFKGHLRFTLINMGSEEFTVCAEKHAVGTLLLFKTSKNVARGWHDMACTAGKAESNGGKAEPDQNEIDALASDFAGINKRMEKIADSRITSLRYLLFNAGLPIIVSSLLSGGIYLYSNFWGQLNSLEHENKSFREELINQKKEIIELEEKLINLGQNKKLNPKNR